MSFAYHEKHVLFHYLPFNTKKTSAFWEFSTHEIISLVEIFENELNTDQW
jgi:hypothetical protein